jgi:hypothetical protein
VVSPNDTHLGPELIVMKRFGPQPSGASVSGSPSLTITSTLFVLPRASISDSLLLPMRAVRGTRFGTCPSPWLPLAIGALPSCTYPLQ